MKKTLLAAIIIAMGILTACGKEEVDSPIIDVTPEPITKETEETEETEEIEETTVETEETEAASDELVLITEREVVDGKMQSYLTGEWKDAEIAQRRNIAVMTPNNKPAMPLYGISYASIIYEAPAEKESCTRLMALYEDYDDLDRIGPVRSSRDYYVYEAMAYDSIYVNWGLAVPYAGPLFDDKRIDNISQSVGGQSNAYSMAFDRFDRPGYAQEFTGYLLVDKVDDAIKAKKYETEYTDRFVQAFTFADAEAGCRAEYADNEDAVKIFPGSKANGGGYEEANSYFTYDDETKLYTRYQHGGVLKDEANGKEIAVSNVVIKICYGEWRDPNGYLAFGVHGTGDAIVFTNGKVIKGTWKRNGDYEPNMFFDENGNEIILNQGKTWICNVMDKYADDIAWE